MSGRGPGDPALVSRGGACYLWQHTHTVTTVFFGYTFFCSVNAHAKSFSLSTNSQDMYSPQVYTAMQKVVPSIR